MDIELRMLVKIQVNDGWVDLKWVCVVTTKDLP